MLISIAYTVTILIMGLFTDMKSKRSRKKFLIASSIIMILISGLRSYYIGSGDTSRYAAMFWEYVPMSLSDIYINADRDPLYHVFTVSLTKIFGNNFQCVLLVIATIFVYAYDKLVYKQSPNLLISFIVLLGMGYFNFSMHGVRQSLGIACVMFAYFPLREKKLIPFLILVILGACFHKSAIIFTIAYPFCRMGFNKNTLFMYAILVVIMLIYGNEIIRSLALDLSEYDDRLVDYAYTDKALSMSGFIQLTLFLILFMTNYKTYIARDMDAKILLTLLTLAILFQTFAIFIAEMFRIAMYFSIFLVVLIPRFLSTYSQGNRKIVTLILCGLLLFYYYSIPYKLQYDFFWND